LYEYNIYNLVIPAPHPQKAMTLKSIWRLHV